MVKRIVFFGDSICVGQHISDNHTWVTKTAHALHDGLDEILGEDELSVYNVSVNGNTTRMALERIQQDLQQFGADCFYTQFGLNDCNYWMTDRGLPRVSPMAFEANLKEIIERARRSEAKIVAIGTNHGTSKLLADNSKEQFLKGISYEESRKKYNDIIRKIASDDKEIVLVDHDAIIKSHIQSGEVTLEQTLYSDGLHLSRIGHNLYFETASQMLVPKFIETIKLTLK